MGANPNQLAIDSDSAYESKILTCLCEHIATSYQNTSPANKKFFSSWFSTKKNVDIKPKEECKSITVHYDNLCRRPLLPQCPEHIGSGMASKCAEKGYGKPMKRKSWFSREPRKIKEKPTNKRAEPVPEPESFRDYIFGPKPPPLDVTNRMCRKEYCYRQAYRCCDSRLYDPRYEITCGDALIFTIPLKKKKCPSYEPKPVGGSEPPIPSSAICKYIHNCCSELNYHTVCTVFKRQLSKPIRCPMHSEAYKIPYSEMRPEHHPINFFTCRQGISISKVVKPPRSHCNYSLPVSLDKKYLPPLPRNHTYCDSMIFDSITEYELPISNAPLKKTSKYERLKQIITQKQLYGNASYFRLNMKC